MLVSRKRSNMSSPPPPPPPLCFVITLSLVSTSLPTSVLITSDLTSWSEHIHSLCMKERKMLGLLYRTFYTDSSSTSLLKLYATVIRPSLEYACQVWDPHLVKDIEKIEGVQKFELRICLKKWELDYSSLLLISNLPTLANRRKYFKLCTMFKIVNQSLHFQQNLFTLRTTPYIHPSSHLYQVPLCIGCSRLVFSLTISCIGCSRLVFSLTISFSTWLLFLIASAL